MTGPNLNPNPNVVVDLRNKEILNSFSYVHCTRSRAIQKFGTSDPADQ